MKNSIETLLDGFVHDSRESIKESGMTAAEYIINDAKAQDQGWLWFLSDDEIDEYEASSAERRAEIRKEITDYVNNNYNYFIEPSTLQLLKNYKKEIIEQVITKLPNAMRGDRVNRTFFVAEKDGEVTVDYKVYLGLIAREDNCFFTISENESFDTDEFGVNDFEEVDFRALEWDKKIEEAIDSKIEEIEMYE